MLGLILVEKQPAYGTGQETGRYAGMDTGHQVLQAVGPTPAAQSHDEGCTIMVVELSRQPSSASTLQHLLQPEKKNIVKMRSIKEDETHHSRGLGRRAVHHHHRLREARKSEKK